MKKDDDIANEAIEYFSGLFSGSMDSNLGELLHLISTMVTREENTRLEEVPDLEDVQRMVFTMARESAASPDGFTGKFFTFAWDIIAQDMHRAVMSFFLWK